MAKGVWRPRSERMTRAEYLERAHEFAHKSRAKLSPDDVKAIRANRSGMTAKGLAERFGVHYRTVEKIRDFETWGDV